MVIKVVSSSQTTCTSWEKAIPRSRNLGLRAVDVPHTNCIQMTSGQVLAKCQDAQVPGHVNRRRPKITSREDQPVYQQREPLCPAVPGQRYIMPVGIVDVWADQLVARVGVVGDVGLEHPGIDSKAVLMPVANVITDQIARCSRGV